MSFSPPLSHPSAGSSGDIRAGGSGRQWHLWTSLQGWCWWWCCCEPSSVRARACVCEQREKMGRAECGGARNVYHHHYYFPTASLLHLDRYLALHKASPPSLGTGAVWPGLSLPDNDLASRCSTDTRPRPLVPPLMPPTSSHWHLFWSKRSLLFFFILLLLLPSSVHTQS